uniref:ACA10 n=1 Tax=Arundo donax TaxID=35708 RepID=A0A0A9CBF4_ARUDO
MSLRQKSLSSATIRPRLD